MVVLCSWVVHLVLARQPQHGLQHRVHIDAVRRVDAAGPAALHDTPHQL